MVSSPQTEALCFGCLSSQLVSGEQNLLETSYETTTFNSNTKLQADVLWWLWFLSVCLPFHVCLYVRG